MNPLRAVIFTKEHSLRGSVSEFLISGLFLAIGAPLMIMSVNRVYLQIRLTLWLRGASR